MTPHSSGLVAVATSALVAAALALTSSTADASVAHPAYNRASAHHRVAPGAHALSTARVSQLRARQQALLARSAPARTLARAAAASASTVQRLTVTTTEDSDLADPTSTRCVDAATGGCSLRAAVDAANNRQTPVRIVLDSQTYPLTSNAQLDVTNPAGTSLVGAGTGHTTIEGTSTTGVLEETDATLASPAPLLYVSDLTVTGGTTVNVGAGFYLFGAETGATLVLDGVAVTGNTAFSGAGLYAGFGSTVYARRSSFTGNVAQQGAALDTENADVNFTDVTITGNHSGPGDTGEGGGWRSQYSVIRMRGGSIAGNTTGDVGAAGYGGGLYDLYGDVALSDVHVDHNAAAGHGQGGGIYAYQDLLEVTGGTISHNRAGNTDGSGGGLYVDTGGLVDLHGVDLRGDRVDDGVTVGNGGGAIYAYGNEFATQLTIDRGSRISGANGSAVYAYTFTGQVDLMVEDSRLSGNTDDAANGDSSFGCGGVVCAFSELDGSVDLTMNHDTVADNTSAGDYGSGAVSFWGTQSVSPRVHLIRSVFRDNASGAGGHGGAVGLYGTNDSTPASLRTESDTFTGNQAGSATGPGRGGAIAIEGLTAYSDTGSVFSRNHARGADAYGGAFYSNGQQSSRFTRSTFTGNSSGPATGGVGHGGAVFVNDQSGSAFTEVSMTGNRTATYGGAIDSSSSGQTVTVEDSTLAGNTAGNAVTTGFGGGIYTDNASLVVENSTVAGNQARSGTDGLTSQGGGVYAGDIPTVDLRYSTVTGNAAQQGGGIFSAADSGTLLGSILSRNQRTGGGEQDCWTHEPVSQPHSLGGNLLGQSGCVTATSTTDEVTKRPRLGALRDNGGPTTTMALSSRSPAVGRATFQCPPTDQRGRSRPATHCDAGAFELPGRQPGA